VYGQSCEGAELVGVLAAETIHPACMCEGGGRGGERGGRAFYYTMSLCHLSAIKLKIKAMRMDSPTELVCEWPRT
jgi:hypothetical protein